MTSYAVVDPATGETVRTYPTIGDAVGEIQFSAAIDQYYADYAEAFLADEPIELMGGEGSAVVRKSSLGVLLGIMPWNFPEYGAAGGRPAAVAGGHQSEHGGGDENDRFLRTLAEVETPR